MKKYITLFLVLVSFCAFGQESLPKAAKKIVEEGKLLFKSEMASWYGTDLFLEQYTDRNNIGGYFSYTEKTQSKCVFFSNSDKPKVIGTISFDESFDLNKVSVDLSERRFSKDENEIYIIRALALKEIAADTLFKSYNNTNLNLIPIINGKEKKVYVLTGPQQNGVVLFGNDYLLTFDKNNKLKKKKQLHNSLIPNYYGDQEQGMKDAVSGIHNHSPETGDYITATDICTLMLYAKFANWESYHVVSEKYMNIWNCKTNELTIISMKTINKIEEDQKKRR